VLTELPIVSQNARATSGNVIRFAEQPVNRNNDIKRPIHFYTVYDARGKAASILYGIFISTGHSSPQDAKTGMDGR
jgi:hypothetical protein